MRKILALCLCLGIFTLLAGCSFFQEEEKKDPSQLSGEELLVADFYTAIHDGNLALVKRLISKGADIHMKAPLKTGFFSKSHVTPMCYAYLEERGVVARYLVEAGSNVNAPCKEKTTVLMSAARQGKASQIEFFLNHGADPNLQSQDGKTALDYAASNAQDAFGQIAAVQLLLPITENVNEKTLELAKANKKTYLAEKLIIEHLISKKQTISASNRLLVAITLGKNVEVEKLLKDKTSARALTNEDLSEYLSYAVAYGLVDIVRLLGKASDGFYTPEVLNNYLLLATKYNNVEMVKHLIDLGADPNYQPNLYEGVLLSAVENCHLQIVELLFEQGATFPPKNKISSNVFKPATHCENIELLEFLAEQGKESFELNEMAYIHTAIFSNRLPVFRYFMNLGIDPNFQLGDSTYLFYAASRGSSDRRFDETERLAFVKMLVEKGANINTQERGTGDTPLIGAVQCGNLKTAQYLLKMGADIAVRPMYGKRAGKDALDSAISNRDLDMVVLLVNHMNEKGIDLYKNDSVFELAKKTDDAEIIEYISKKR